MNSKFIIKKTSRDVVKFNKKDVVFYNSLQHYIAICSCKCIISTHICSFVPGDYSELKKLKHFSFSPKIVWLRHGISYAYHEENTYPKLKIDLFICSAQREYDYIIETYKYPKSIVQMTGLARFDNLHLTIETSRIQKTFLFMPTWRMWINKKDILSSDYFKAIVELLSNKQLINYLNSTKSKLLFYPHFETQKYITFFEKYTCDVIKVVSFDKKSTVQELLIDADVLITDYSSVHFDFAYMNKPIIYYQFDSNHFYSTHYKRGYFNFYQDGFGPVCTTSEDVVSKIIHADINSEQFIKRRETFFTYRDHNNCDRIMKAIENLYDNNKN